MFSLPIFPIFARPCAGLRRIGPFTWRSTDDDPHFVIRLAPRPRYLLILLDGLGAPLDPMIYFNTGEGFLESASRPLEPADRIACVIALHRFPELRGIRLDPTTQQIRFRVSVFGVRLLRLTRWLIEMSNWFSPRSLSERSLFVTELVDGMEWGAVDGVWGSRLKSASLERHFNHVVALAGQMPAVLAQENSTPVVSIVVPVFNAAPRHLDALLASVRAQDGASYELILSDDGSTRTDTRQWLETNARENDVTVVRAAVNGGIAAATNAGLARACGRWVALLDHDDALAPHVLKMFARALERRPGATFFYTDEVVVDDELRPVQYFVKPAFDPVLLSGVNYINHLSFYRRDRLGQIGGLDAGFQGSQDYDLLLRYLDGLTPEEVVHVPYPGYLWRRHRAAHSTTSKSAAVANARRALVRAYSKTGTPVTVEPALLPDLHRLRFDIGRTDWPSVSVVIPNRDLYELVATVLKGLAERTDYPALQVIIVDNGSTDARVLSLYEQSKRQFPDVAVSLCQETFNFSRAVNRGIAMASGSLVLLLNNDIEMIDPGWLKEMVSCFAYPNTGIVGARLLYPNHRIQHAGVIVGLGGLAGHWFSQAPEKMPGPMGRLAVRQSLSAVTAAAMLISRACIDATGPFDEEAFAIAYNDVDFCLRAAERGFRVVWTPFATLIHHELDSRRRDERPEIIERFRQEQGRLRERHGTVAFVDRAFSPWYTRDRSNPIYKFRSELPECR